MCIVVQPPGRVTAPSYVTHQGLCILSSPPLSGLGAPGVDVWLVERVGSTGIGWMTGASCCLQLENTLLHSFGYSQIKSLPA